MTGKLLHTKKKPEFSNTAGQIARRDKIKRRLLTDGYARVCSDGGSPSECPSEGHGFSRAEKRRQQNFFSAEGKRAALAERNKKTSAAKAGYLVRSKGTAKAMPFRKPTANRANPPLEVAGYYQKLLLTACALTFGCRGRAAINCRV